ncbi:MAG TPA: multicopper oxidase, partial [Terriglobales bacterium]|nr:multicopper oxidase [Terriglobales bacterium]
PLPINPKSLATFVDPLPIPRVLSPTGTRPNPDDPSVTVPYYRVAMKQIQSKIHRDLKPARLWGFGNSSPGPTIEARSGQGVLVEWVNELPAQHFLPIDHTLHGAEADKPDVRAVTHLHGGRVPAKSDGYPEDWYVPGKSATYFYPNQQDAATLWYHDHAMGITRLNTYAGMFGLYLIRDKVEDSLNLPKGKYEIPLTMFDRSFDRDGQLFYPTSGDPESPWVSEVFGEAILVNGKLFPYLEVEPRKYRFRLLNASNARFLHLRFSNGQEFHQIGTDLGLLPAPAPLKSLLLAPAERADLIVDFSGQAGKQIVLSNDTLTVMQFRVAQTGASDSSAMPAALREVPRTPEASAVKTRILTIGEKDDMSGIAKMMLLNNAHWAMPVTENPTLDSTEIWELLNFTDDSHPIHLHMVRFQILDRRSFEPQMYYHGGKIHYIGQPVPPDPNEAGWKDTVQAHPGMVTRIIIKFEGYVGRYVWHCHLLEHEDNEMMRPYDVIAPASANEGTAK